MLSSVFNTKLGETARQDNADARKGLPMEPFVEQKDIPQNRKNGIHVPQDEDGHGVRNLDGMGFTVLGSRT